VSLFGMAISAAELPLLSSALGDERAIAAAVRARLEAAMRRVAYFIVPSAIAFAALGNVVTAGIYQTGEFGADDVRYVWGILAASAVGLLATTLARLFSATYYALRDTRTPLRFACVRLAVGVAIAIPLAFFLPGTLGLESRWGAAGLALASGIAGWIELWLLRRALERRIGRARLPGPLLARLWSAAIVCAAIALAVESGCGDVHPVVAAVVVLGSFGGLYLASTLALGVAEARAVAAQLAARLRRA